YRVSASGGMPQQVTHLDRSRSEATHRSPYFLPDGNHFLFMIRRPWTPDQAGDAIYIASLDQPNSPRILLNASSNVAYVDGYVLFVRDRTLFAQPFDARTLQLRGDARPVTHDPIGYHSAGFALFDASPAVVLVLAAGSPA